MSVLRYLSCCLSLMLLGSASIQANTVDDPILWGIILLESIDEPVTGARVWIQGGDVHQKTTTTGQFKLNLNVGQKQKESMIKVAVNHPTHGYSEHWIPTNNRQPKIKIAKNGRLMLFSGTVKDKKNYKSLKGIKVTVHLKDINSNTTLPITLTDDNGWFQFVLPKAIVGNSGFARLSFKDESGRCYESLEVVEDMRAHRVFSLEKEPCRQDEIQLELKERASLKVELGDHIIIEATGSIRIGDWTGYADPEGKRNGGVMNLPLDKYSFFPAFPHAALLYKFEDEPDSAWRLCGKRTEFFAQQSGRLVFLVNDKDYQNNSGVFTVNIKAN